MPYYDEQGQEVEGVLSPEEVEEKMLEKETEMNKAIEEAQTSQEEEIKTLQAQMTEKEEELKKLQEKDANFGALRKKAEVKEEEIAKMQKQIDDLKGGLVGQIEKINQVLSEKQIDEAALKTAEGDKELADKIKFHYKSFSGEPKDTQEAQQRMDNALILATGGKVANLGGSVISGAGGSTFQGGNVESQTKWTDEQKDMAQKLGITDADIAKYQGKMPRYAGDRRSNKDWLNSGNV